MRAARRVLQLGAPLIVVAAVASPLFELDRYQMPKELILHAAAFGAAALALRRVRELPLAMVDLLLIGYGVMVTVSAVLATNGWLAFRAAGITWAGLAIFWTARGIARSGLAGPLLGMLAFASVLGAVSGLLQAYGVELPFESARRAPGGMFGNRNFMAHTAAIGLPLLAFLTLDARTRVGPALGAFAVTLSAAALLLSRSRAAWLAAAAGLTILLVEGILVSGLWNDRRVRVRLIGLGVAAALGIGAGLTLPNTLSWRAERPYLDSLVGVANFRDGSGRGRLIQYGNTLRMAGGHPVLGVGPGNWQVAYPRYTTPGDPAFHAGDPVPTNPWPSSDWVAMIAERGAPALALLFAAGGVMAFVGVRRSRERRAAPEGLAGLTVVATIVVAAVVGTFDAVVLLAAPTFFLWATLGALLPAPRQIFRIPEGRPVHLVLAATLVAGALFTLHSAAQTSSIIAAGSGDDRASLLRAAELDPGSYRLQMLLAGGYGKLVPCEQVRTHAARARDLFPYHATPRWLLSRCEG